MEWIVTTGGRNAKGADAAMKLESLDDLFLEELADLHSAEQQLVRALPRMAKAAGHPRLKAAFERHLEETRSQLQRLDTIVSNLERKPKSKTCKAMKGLLDEGEELLKASGDAAVVDAGLISAAQRVEHYEIAAYGCARTFAELLGDERAAAALETSLKEEKAADAKLTEIARQLVNTQAARS
jgi:ferritin-like metal-binding protein YciE